MRFLLLAALLLSAGTAWADPGPRFTAVASVDISDGRYGEAASTTIISSDFSLRTRWGDWSASLAVSHVKIDGPSDIIVAEGAGQDRRPPNEVVSGLGDTLLTVARDFDLSETSPLYVTAVAKLRLPTGDEDKGLGVGAVDVMLASEVGWSADAGGASVRLTRRFLGDPGYRRRDGWQAEAAVWWNASSSLQLGADYEYRELAFANEPASEAAEMTLSYRLRSRLWLMTALSKGLSSTAADNEVTAGVRIRL